MKFFDDVKAYSFFIAPSRSGHSIIAHLLSAHPKILFSDELDAFYWFDEGFEAEQVYSVIKHQNMRYGKKGQLKSGYDYKIPGSMQYAWEKYPQVIGDAKGRRSSERIAEDPSFLDRLKKTVGVPIRAIVQMRHPYAMVASEKRNRLISLEEAMENIVGDMRHMDEAVGHLNDEEKLFIYHEDFLKDPETYFRQIFEFFGVDTSDEYVKLCASKIWKKPSKGGGKKKKKAAQPKKKGKELEYLDGVMRESPLFRRYVEDPALEMNALPKKRKDAFRKWAYRGIKNLYAKTAK